MSVAEGDVSAVEDGIQFWKEDEREYMGSSWETSRMKGLEGCFFLDLNVCLTLSGLLWKCKFCCR